MHRTQPSNLVVLGALALVITGGLLVAGPLDPPAGPISPTYKTLTEVEPRIAINSANTPGDANSLFKITQPGSYYLTGNVTGQSGKFGIEISASNVSIDLMGFTVQGVPGSISGIAAASPLSNLCVRNGVVTSWGDTGVDLAGSGLGNEGAVVEDVIATSNATQGVMCGDSSSIRFCTFVGNGSEGLRLIGNRNGGVVESCVARENWKGIRVGNATIIRACQARDNSNDGISTGASCTVSDCVAEFNLVDGFVLGLRSVATHCTAGGNSGNGFRATDLNTNIECCSANSNVLDGIIAFGVSRVSGCTLKGNGGDGIEVSSDSYVLNNVAQGNGGAGIRATSSDNRIESNNVSNNAQGLSIDVAGNIVTRNTASGNTTNYVIVAGNAVGIIAATPASGAISGSTGGAGLGSSDPWANFSY